MTRLEQESYRQQLEGLLQTLESQLAMNKDSARPVSLDESIGRLARMDRMQNQQVAADQARRLEQRIARVRSAIARIHHGDYGECLECGEDIEERRLLFQPEVSLCLECQQRRE